MELDFDKEFQSFVAGNSTSAIKDIYHILPSLNQEQMMVLDTEMFYIDKWQLDDLRKALRNYLMNISSNKNLGALSTFQLKSLFKAYTQDELIRGIKIQSSQVSGIEK